MVNDARKTGIILLSDAASAQLGPGFDHHGLSLSEQWSNRSTSTVKVAEITAITKAVP